MEHPENVKDGEIGDRREERGRQLWGYVEFSAGSDLTDLALVPVVCAVRDIGDASFFKKMKYAMRGECECPSSKDCHFFI